MGAAELQKLKLSFQLLHLRKQKTNEDYCILRNAGNSIHKTQRNRQPHDKFWPYVAIKLVEETQLA